MTSRTHQEVCEEFIRLLVGFTPQAITELDQTTLQALRDRLGSLSVVLFEEHLWRFASGAWPFPLDGDGHEVGSLTVRELPALSTITKTYTQYTIYWHTSIYVTDTPIFVTGTHEYIQRCL